MQDSGLLNEYLVLGGGKQQAGDEYDCPVLNWTNSATIPDGKGYTAILVDGGGYGPSPAAVYDSAGDEIDGEFKDHNDNAVSVTSSNGNTDYNDPLGSDALTQSGTGPITYTWTGPNGTGTVTEDVAPVSVSTSFGCSGVTEYTGTPSLPSELVLADGTKYFFDYDTEGRLISVTLPTGGTISYSYTLDCSGIGNDSLTRSDSVNGSTHGWSWSRTLHSDNTVTTTETQPELPNSSYANQIVFDFAAPQWPGEGGALTEADFWQGAAGSGTELESVNVSNTLTNGYVSAQTTAFELFGSTPLYRESVLNFDDLGSRTVQDDYDWSTTSPGDSTLLRQTTTTFTVVNNVADLPTNVTVKDGANNTLAETITSYDSWGDPATVDQYVNGSTYLQTTYSYALNGNLLTVTRPNSATVSYTYGTGSGGCAESGNGGLGVFPTEVQTETASSTYLTTYANWNCSGGVMTSSKDANGNTTSYTYADSAETWRPTSVTDPASNVAYIVYPTSSSPNTSERYMNFNGSTSTADSVTVTDGLGRPILTQKRQGQGSSYFDTVQSTYDYLDRPSTVSVPYSGTAGETAPSGTAVTTTTYDNDALGRPAEVEDGGGGWATYSYAGNDVLTSTGPPPTGENTKERQGEFDGLGRLTSVCEITTGAGYGTCGQYSGQNGYWTKYAYTAAGQLAGVTQNAQSSTTETRSFSYDWLGRMTQEKNPETGTTNYTFDTDSTCGTYTGAQVKRADNAGNITCYAYDLDNRITEISYPTIVSGFAPTPPKYFVYDAATVDSASMANAEGQLAEAYTGTPSSKTTDLGFSYTALGQITETWQSSPNSGGYYTTTLGYYANGAPDGLYVPGISNAFSYGVDGEGRVNAVTNGSSTLVYPNSTTYPNGALYGEFGLAGLEFGSGDYDSYAYDSSTGRMNQYQLTVNSQTDTGQLGWNTDGELGSLDITDNITGTSDSQNCSYTHDDLGRLASVNCGSAWSQTFTLDPFGNVSKTAGAGTSFSASFNVDNEIASIDGNWTPNYDSDGNLLDDPVTENRSVNTFDAAGRPTTFESIPLTYDALGRAAEAGPSGSVQEFVYGPAGSKLAVMSGQTLDRADIPLPGGAEATFGAGGLAYYKHADWLGSARLTSTPSQGLVSSDAYAPYGEDYTAADRPFRRFTRMTQDIADGSAGGTDPNGQYDFLMREYSPTQSRWWSPDPAGLAAVDPNNPQSWNRYAYVLNTPLSAVDPTGLCPFRCLTWPPSCLNNGGQGCNPPIPPGNDGGNGFSFDDWLASGELLQLEEEQAYFSQGSNGPSSPGGGGSTITASPQPQAPANPQVCDIADNFVQRAGIALLSWAAKVSGWTIGLGAGSSAGAGAGLGETVGLSRQIIVSPSGAAAFETTYSFGALPGGFTLGIGALGGLVLSASGATSPSQLAGSALDVSGGFGDVWALGADTSFGQTWQTSITGGFGAGGFGGAGTFQATTVAPICGTGGQ